MKKVILLTVTAVLMSLYIIIIFLLISTWLKTEKPGFVTVSVLSFLTSILVTKKYPETKWYLPVLIYLPLLSILIFGYKGDGMKHYLTNVLICILISYLGAFIGVWLCNRKRTGFSRSLKAVLYITVLSIIILLTGYLTWRNARLDKPLIAVLDTIFKADQSLIQENKGWDIDSPEWKSWNAKCIIMDSINIIKIADIINNYGWLGEDIIGWYGSSTLWVVIQHSTLENQEKYAPLLREAVKNGKARPGYLALLEDRILKNQGKEQIYGTHVTVDSLGNKMFWPIKDERTVNKRRFMAGLGPIQWYAKQMGFEYSLKESTKKEK